MRLSILIIFSLCFIANNSTVTADAEYDSIEYEIKSAFLYNIAKFISWPQNNSQPVSDNHFIVCILGQDPFGPIMDNLTNKKIHNRSLKVRRFSTVDERENCQIIFVSRSEKDQLNVLLKLFANDRGLLTISDIKGFAKSGGNIELLVKKRKVRFVININSIRHADLTVSSKLLRLATQIVDTNDH